MGLLSGLFWMLAGGAYGAGELFKDHVNSQGSENSDIVHNFKWYQNHALELDHDRQEELYSIYKSDPDLIERMSGRKQSSHRNDEYYRTGGVEGSYFAKAASDIADKEGWTYDEDFRLNPYRKNRASVKAMNDMDKYKSYVKESRVKFEESVKGKHIPYIGDGYNWWIEGVDTGIRADPKNFPVVDDGMWRFGSHKTEFVSLGGVLPLDTAAISSELMTRDGYWHIPDPRRGHYRDRVLYNTGIEVVSGAHIPEFGEHDEYLWYNGTRTSVRIDPRRLTHIGNEWAVVVYLEGAGYAGPYKISTGVPIVKRFRYKEDSKFISEILALTGAAWYGWESDTAELNRLYVNHAVVRRRVEAKENFPSRLSHISAQPNGDDISEAIRLDNDILFRAHGIIPGPPDPKTLEAERKRRLKAHENPAKLNEWCNLFFDLVHGEEKLRAESPGEYEKLLEKFKEITGEDFVRGVDYLDKLRGLAIADGWYIPSISNKWFDNPLPPKPPEEPYGTAKLPTRYS